MKLSLYNIDKSVFPPLISKEYIGNICAKLGLIWKTREWAGEDIPVGEENENIVISASRTSGIAPLSVFFDATSTPISNTSFFANDGNGVNGSYMDATFYWDFDSTNVDATIDHKYGSGFVAACVFKEPGIYTVQLKVYDNTGYIGYKNITITVSAFSGTTYYVASNGSDSSADGTNITTPFLTVSKGLSYLGANKRVLFRNGDTFNLTSTSISSKTGPWIIGGYSDPNSPSSVNPIIHSTMVNSGYNIISCGSCSDGRVMDITFTTDGNTYSGSMYPQCFYWDNSSTYMLKYKVTEHKTGRIGLWTGGRYTSIAECTIYDTTQSGWASTDGSAYNDHNALIGNRVYNVNNNDPQHIFRIQGGSEYYIAYNNFGDEVFVNYDALTIRGNTQKIVIYKNRFKGWAQSTRPQNNSYAEYQHHIIWDSNNIIGDNQYSNEAQMGLWCIAKDVVYRNNIISNYGIGINLENYSIVGNSTRLKIYNNTFLNTISNGVLRGIQVANYAIDNIFIRNNLMLDVGGASSIYLSFINIFDGSTFNGTSDYNLMYGSTWGSSPLLFDGNTLSTWKSNTGQDLNSIIQNFSLQSVEPSNSNFGKLTLGNPAINSGQILPYNALDFYVNLRGNLIDIGACEWQ